MRFGLDMKGGQEWARALNQLPEKLQSGAIYAALHRSAGVVQKAIKRAAPVGTEPTRKTRRVFGVRVSARAGRYLRLAKPVSVSYDYGRLRDNIRRRRLNARRTGEIGVQVTRGRAFWAFFLERGAGNVRPHPFWQRAAAAAEAEARAVFAEAFRGSVRTALSRTYRPPR